MIALVTVAGFQTCLFSSPATIDPDSIIFQTNFSYASMNASAWIVPPERTRGFLFEVQPMNYPPFLDTVVNNSVVKYHLGETTLYDPTGFTDGEWDYSFYHLLNGALDGAGRPSWGGYSTPPANRAEALSDIQKYFLNITDSQPRPWYTFTGHYTYQHYAAEWGSDCIGSEIGENINGYQQSIAFNRGAARQYGKPWFIDVSAWNSGGITDYSTAKPWGSVSGPNNGHSLSLYNRTYYMSYMAGTGTLIAEAGGVNFFVQQLDSDNCFVPSPLGLVGQGLYNFTQRHPDPGIPYTPFAMLLDYYHGMYMGDNAPELAFEYFPYDAGDYMSWNLLNTFFPGSWNFDSTNEQGTLVNTPWGDSLDVLLQDASPDVLSSYPVIIPSGDITFTQTQITNLINYVDQGGVLLLNTAYTGQFPSWFAGGMDGYCNYITTRQHGNGTLLVFGPRFSIDQACNAAISALASRLLPFGVTGDGNVEYLINRRANSWVITLINNNGVTKDIHDPPQIDPSQAKSVTIHYRLGAVSSIKNWLTDRPVPVSMWGDGKTVTMDIPPGGISVLEFVTA